MTEANKDNNSSISISSPDAMRQDKAPSLPWCNPVTDTSAGGSSNAPLLFTPPQTQDKEVERHTHDNNDKNDQPPPMSVIVVSTPTGPRPSSSSASTTRRSSPPSMFSTPFRLQPRSAMTATTTGRDGAIRGRKRSAHSMNTSSSMARESMLTAKPTPTKLAPKSDHPIMAGLGPPQQTTLVSAALATPPKRPGLTPPRDTNNNKRRMDHAVVNFQCLSLQSPKRKDLPVSPPKSFPSPPQTSRLAHTASGIQLPPPSSSSSSCGTAPQRPAMVPGSVSSSAVVQPRSSFTPVYNAASPCGSIRSIGSGSIGSNTRMNVSARAAAYSPSACAGGASSNKSSPKIAPLTVLKGGGSKQVSQQREGNPRLPPLPGGGMSSLWLSLESTTGGSSGNGGGGDNNKGQQQDDPRMWPPRTIHCRNPSSDSISTVQNSVLSPLPRPSPKMSPRIFSSPTSAAAGPLPPGIPTPRSSKHRRLEESPGATGLPRTPRTPQTPLPRVTLTPRSTSSRRSRQSSSGQGLPRFPSPSDADIMDVTSPFLNSAAAACLRDASTSNNHRPAAAPAAESHNNNNSNFAGLRPFFPASSNSLALSADGSANEGCKEAASSSTTEASNRPLPILGLSMKKMEPSSSFEKKSLPAFGDLSGGSFMGIQTKSLLTPSKGGGILQAMMEEKPAGGADGDFGSVSDIDEDEGFVLASPDAIEQERFASYQPARQRRRRSCDRSSTASPTDASNTNLAGMNYVTSNTSLFGMDIAHPTETTLTDRKTASDEAPSSPAKQLMFGSAACDSKPTQDHQCMKRRKSDASFASIGLTLEGPSSGDGGRDLVTPPAMPTPETPPPLSPKEGDFMPVIMPHGTVYHHATAPAGSVCVAGADRKSVTMAIARMAFEAQHHSGSSPVS